MNVYKSRYRNALRSAARINRYIKKGYHVFHDGAPIEPGARFVMCGDELLFQASPQMSYVFFKNDANWDHGYWTKITDFNKHFNESFEVYRPEARIKL